MCFGPLVILAPACVAVLENALAINSVGIGVAEIGAGATLMGGSRAIVTRTIASEMGTIQTFNNFNAAKKTLGSISGKDIHHVVEQCQAKLNRSGFSENLLNSTNNLIRLDEDIHQSVSNFYGGRAPGGGRIRDTLNGRSFEEQFDFGMDVVMRAINGTL